MSEKKVDVSKVAPRVALQLVKRWEADARAAAGDVQELRRVAGELYDLVEDLAIELEEAKRILPCNWIDIPLNRSFVRRRQRILSAATDVLDRHQDVVARVSSFHDRAEGARFRCWEFDAASDAHDVHEGGC